MRQLWPTSIEGIDLLDAFAPPPHEATSHLRINMVSSLDGAISIEGKSEGLSGPADRRAFHTMRGLADVILVGAGTMREENYGPSKMSPEEQARRQGRGQNPIPPIAVVTRSASFDWNAPFFRDAASRPIILTTHDGAIAAQGAPDVADIIECGSHDVDLALAIKELASRGLTSLLCEGGPTLNADLLSAGLVNELCLTISPLIVQGSGKKIFDGSQLETPAGFDTTHVFMEDGFLFLRLACKQH
ncbi:MAG TPA: pyrimidine reductase family protein [Acidimicrobiia bacterium]|nr:pyrimidine reductase family protein [Acidimicrobiia bacterium]